MVQVPLDQYHRSAGFRQRHRKVHRHGGPPVICGRTGHREHFQRRVRSDQSQETQVGPKLAEPFHVRPAGTKVNGAASGTVRVIGQRTEDERAGHGLDFLAAAHPTVQHPDQDRTQQADQQAGHRAEDDAEVLAQPLAVVG